jgi:hypothetical protein
MDETYHDPTTNFKYSKYLVAGGTAFQLRGCGVNRVLLFIIYGCCYYTSAKFANDAILIKMYRSIGKGFIIRSIRKSLQNRYDDSEKLEDFLNLISTNFDSFKYQDEILLLFNENDLEVYKHNDDKYELLKIFVNQTELSQALRNCFFDEKSVTPTLRDKIKEYLT